MSERYPEVVSDARHVLATPPARWSHRLRALGTHPRAMHYNRLILLVVMANVWLLYTAILAGWWRPDEVRLEAVSYAVLANLGMAILMRQRLVINLLFRVATSAPTSWPLAVRRQLGKVYHFGGLHVGGSLMGTLWFLVFTASLTYAAARHLAPVSPALLVVSYLLLGVLGTIVVLALPASRARRHDVFEWSHRFGGWAALALFWTQTLLLIRGQQGSEPFGQALVSAPGFWVLLLLTLSVAAPWFTLRRVPVRIDRPSSHVALAQFDYGLTPFASSATSISRHPLRDWHTFANVPAVGPTGFRLVISRAGDWTGQLIDAPPTHLWVRGGPTAGVGYIDRLFQRVIWVATGSGIGPTLPQLFAQQLPAHLIWSTKAPRATYGDALVDEILSIQPGALIWDTDERGRPDLLHLAHQACKQFGAEAVICISNKTLTWEVVSGLERLGIPAYGAIWDS